MFGGEFGRDRRCRTPASSRMPHVFLQMFNEALGLRRQQASFGDRVDRDRLALPQRKHMPQASCRQIIFSAFSRQHRDAQSFNGEALHHADIVEVDFS